MGIVDVLVLILAFIVMLVGLAGAILPVLPGLPIIWAAMLGYGFYSGWAHYGLPAMVITGLLVAVSVAVDQLASVIGAKKFGASRPGMIGSFAGAIVGVMFFNIIGLIAGTFLGAMVCEIIFEKRDLKAAVNSGAGALAGFMAGGFFKFTMGVVLIGYFIYALIFVSY
ncbi:MAG: DUF456 domain-containing protein [Candidatus Adiutrix sp.]|jgi:uncharacterized protein YqgC (DUF456 family)|nr:DUF456 domain-containing protein [Candidatus Adiutrix sp.]